jgi:hypothetical protein
MQALGTPGKTEKTLITRKVTENCSCIFCIHTFHGDYREFFCFTMRTNCLHVFFAPN